MWAATITNQNQRTNQIDNLAETWLRNDSAAARKWISGTDQLTPERKAQFLKREQ